MLPPQLLCLVVCDPRARTSLEECARTLDVLDIDGLKITIKCEEHAHTRANRFVSTDLN